MKNPDSDRMPRRAAGVAALAAALALALYLCTLGQTITGEDSGEFVTAAWVLGIPHPPGYPLYCLIAHPFTWIPFGEPAWRVNLVSAVFAAGAVFWTALITARLTRQSAAGMAAGLALACSREFWAQAVIAEVYAMNAFWTVLCWWLALRWTETRRSSWLYALAVCTGLGLALHNTFVLLAPLLAAYVLCLEWKAQPRRAPMAYVPLVAVALSGLLVYLYLPIRSLADPLLDWGNPETLENFWRVVRRAQYDFMVFQYPRGLTRFLEQFGVQLRFWLWEFGPWGAALGGAGVLLCFRRMPRYGVLLVASVLVIVAGFTWWQNFEMTREWLWVMRVFTLPANAVTAIGIGIALDAIARHGGPGRAAALACGLACVIGTLYLYYERNDKSDYYWTRDYGRNILDSLERDAIYISESDHGSFSVLYLQAVQGHRPDVDNLRKYGYLQSRLFEEMPEALRARIGPFPRKRYEPEIFAWLLQHTDRPVYFARMPVLPRELGIRFEQAGLLFRAVRPGETFVPRDHWTEYRWHTLDPAATRGDYTADAILYEIEKVKAHAAFMAGRDAREEQVSAEYTKQGLRHLEQALAYYGEDPVVLNNAGVLCARYKHYDAARHYFERAHARLPRLAEPRRNLERLRERAGEPFIDKTP